MRWGAARSACGGGKLPRARRRPGARATSRLLCCFSRSRRSRPHPRPAPLLLPLPSASSAAVIDNLVKGASGQAIQNMNLLFGLPEETALLQQALFP